jgi:predicted  nucleic acid-binding Zn ribbon protein
MNQPAHAGVICFGHLPEQSCGHVDLDYNQYMEQLSFPDSTWRCPQCGAEAEFDDDRYESIHFPGDECHAPIG